MPLLPTCRRSVPTTVASPRAAPHPRHRAGSWVISWSATSTYRNVLPGWPGGRPGPRPVLRRNDFGAGLASPSDDGGLPEFFDVIPSRASSASIRANAWASASFNWAFSTANSSYDS